MNYFDCNVHQEDKDEIYACLSCYDDSVKQEERERIIRWIEENRSKIELEAGIFVYRDHFDSESLLNFINENK